MKLVSNLRRKMRAYSIWAMMLSLALFLLPEFYFAYFETELASPYAVGRLALFMGVFGIVGWFIDQSNRDYLRTGFLALISLAISAAVVLLLALPSYAMDTAQTGPEPVGPATPVNGLPTWEQTAVYAIPILQRWEGTGPTFSCTESESGTCVRAYLDTIAEPDLWTICYGETSHTGTLVQRGDTRTIERCVEGLYRLARDNYWALYRTGVTIDHMPAQVDASFAELTWNIGPSLMLKASAMVSLNRGDFADACRRLTFYNRSGGRVIRGLVNRRAYTNKICMSGVA
jgi:lysozyme